MTSEITSTQNHAALVVRSVVPQNKPYNEYSCGFETTFFTLARIARCQRRRRKQCASPSIIISQKRARPDLIDAYNDLMYCCDECNIRKGDRYRHPMRACKGSDFFGPTAIIGGRTLRGVAID